MTLTLDDLTTGSQATCDIDVSGLFFDMLFMGVLTTGRLVQELNICTDVPLFSFPVGSYTYLNACSLI